MRWALIVLGVTLACVIGCSEHARDSVGDGNAAVTDFMSAGSYTVTASAGSLSASGCELAYTLYTSEGAASRVLVILGHGFTRAQANVADIAEHIASYGVRVVTPSYCHSSFLDANHVQNGADAVALAAHLSSGAPVVYAGHSAGGLSAVVAAAQDGDTLAVLGLDLTDVNGAALDAAASVDAPGLGLLGGPTVCNAQGNGAGVFAALDGAKVIEVVGASHCDFESPSVPYCDLTCGAMDAGRARLIQALAAAFVAWQAGVDPTGEAWVTPTGSELVRLERAGALAVVQ